MTGAGVYGEAGVEHTHTHILKIFDDDASHCSTAPFVCSSYHVGFLLFFSPFFDSLPACLGCVQLDSSQRTHIQTFYGWMIPTYFTLSSVIFVKLGCYNAIYSLVIQDGDGHIRREKIQNALPLSCLEL